MGDTTTQARLIDTIRAHLDKGDKAVDKAQQHYIAAGKHLATLKQHTGNWAEWEELLKSKIGMSTGRASELMQIADGRKTFEQVRAETAQRVAQHREISSLRNEEEAATPSASHAVAVVEPVRRGIITGNAMSPYAERGLDCYETPNVATRALLKVEELLGPIWEPACGRGAIVDVLRAAGHRVIATDIADYGCPDSTGGVDFLQQDRAPDGVGIILTNPPFMHTSNFVRHALTLVPCVIMLQRLGFLAGQGRSDILDGGTLARVYVFANRLPPMHRDGWEGQKVDSNAMDFMWCVWDRRHCGPIEVRRIWWSADDEAEALEDAA
jgi:hypothetical protein